MRQTQKFRFPPAADCSGELVRRLILLTKGGWMHKKQGLAKTQVPEYYLNRERVEIFYANQERPCCDRPPRYLCSSKRRSGYDGDKKA